MVSTLRWAGPPLEAAPLADNIDSLSTDSLESDRSTNKSTGQHTQLNKQEVQGEGRGAPSCVRVSRTNLRNVLERDCKYCVASASGFSYKIHFSFP